MKDKRQNLFVAVVVLLGAAAFCSYQMMHHYNQIEREIATFEQMAESVEQTPGELPEVEVLPVNEGDNILPEYQTLFLQNADMIGWLKIADTTINYPVMQTKNQPDYYLKHNFEQADSSLGVPYVQENCDLAASDNLLIYGHHIRGGKMFGALENYKSENFYKEHRIIQFDTLTEHREYEIVTVFTTVAYSSAGYRYYDFVDAENEDDFQAYLTHCQELAVYDTGVTAEHGDQLLTLSTCEYSANNGRLVIVAKRVV